MNVTIEIHKYGREQEEEIKHNKEIEE